MKTIIFILTTILFNLQPVQSQVTQALVNTYPSRCNIENLKSLIEADNKGNYYTSFMSEGLRTGKDFSVLKYTGNGKAIWEVKYNGSGNGLDEPRAMITDGRGNVYITGRSYLINGKYECVTIKINNTGNIEWTDHYSVNSGGNSSGSALGIDASGYIYTAGTSGSLRSDDILLIKLDTDGNRIWQKTFDGTEGLEDNAYAITTYKNNIYICGDSRLLAEDYNFITLKYDDNGNLNWFRTLAGTENSWDMGRSICTDKNGNVLVTGYISNLNTKQDFTTVKYDVSGNLIWRNDFNGTANGYDWTNHIKADESGNAYICGGSQNLTVPNPECVANLGKCQNDATLIKYKSTGETDWVRIYNGPDNYYDCLQGLDLDNKGNVYVTGRSHYEGNSNNDEIITFKYSGTGTRLWFMKYGLENFKEYGNDISVDIAGNVFVIGTIFNEGLFDMLTVKYTQNENLTSDNFENKITTSSYPNPFNPSTKISFTIPFDGFVSVKIFDISGKMIDNLMENNLSAGSYETEWNAVKYSSGVYFYKIVSGNFTEIRKIILLK
ncbi:MAG TPA: T9SS type A sorting domain-containing protein [Ignavibacteria bacterium]|nr:T9SS type A sorting domain-containing protein [Ignavibacteria bacterium]